ncbi:MAG TPA: DUF2975 domain-containing protein [Desulfobulbus sp.]|nr:DUF2975 domain-containing protein [Desulfobulbus sp.]
MERLQMISRRLQIAIFVIIVLTPAIVALDALFGEWREVLNIPGTILIDNTRVYGVSLLLMIGVASIKPAATMLAFWFLYKLLGYYHKGIIFTEDTVTAIRKIGWALVSIDVAGMFQTLVTGPLLTMFHITPGYFSVQLQVDFLIVGIFIVLVAYVMDMGRELQEQDSLVI